MHEFSRVNLTRIIDLYCHDPHWPTAVELAVRRAKRVQQVGRGPGSLEDESTAGLDYHVLTAPMVKEHLRWLWQMYTSDLMRDFVCGVLSRDVWRAQWEMESCINVNYLMGPGGRYEWHTDPQRWTMVLFASGPHDGGYLELFPSGTIGYGVCHRFAPRPGEAVIFDSAAIPHRVTELAQEELRVTIPMVFHTEQPIDDSQTNAYLYAEKS